MRNQSRLRTDFYFFHKFHIHFWLIGRVYWDMWSSGTSLQDRKSKIEFETRVERQSAACIGYRMMCGRVIQATYMPVHEAGGGARARGMLVLRDSIYYTEEHGPDSKTGSATRTGKAFTT